MMEKSEKYLFYVFLFCLPFQTRLILHKWTLPFNEWTAAFLYFSDILLLLIFALWAARSILKRKKISWSEMPAWFWPLAVFFLISAVSIYNSRLPGLAWYRLLKLAEFIALFFYAKTNNSKIFNFTTAAAVVAGSGAFQALIAVIQYFKQASIGLKILGESRVAPEIYNVAVFIADGHKYLRAYGTFPHPNVLAAWLVLAIFAFYFLFISGFKKLFVGKGYFWLVPYGLLLWGLFFTFSRTMIGVWALASLVGFFILFKRHSQKILRLVMATAAICAVFVIIFWPQVKTRALISGDEEAVTQRLLYNKIAGGVTRTSPLAGVGIGQSVADLMDRFKYYPQYFYQPVHNIYLLISSETGLAGLAAFILFLITLCWNFWQKSKLDFQYRLSILAAIFSFLLIGLFDHFLWTLQQGSLVLWLTLALFTI